MVNIPWKSHFPKPNLQRRLIFIILLLPVLLAATMNFMSFFLNWEDTVHLGVRTTSDFWDLADGDCADHPWSKDVYQECRRSSGVGALGAHIRAEDCSRVCEDHPCATNRRIAATVIVWATIISFIVLFKFLVVMIVGLFVHIWLPLVSALYVLSIALTTASWLPFWLSRHGYLASCPGTDYCPDDAARCDTHGLIFMFASTALLCLGGTASLFFDCIYLRFARRRAADVTETAALKQ